MPDAQLPKSIDVWGCVDCGRMDFEPEGWHAPGCTAIGGYRRRYVLAEVTEEMIEAALAAYLEWTYQPDTDAPKAMCAALSAAFSTKEVDRG